MTTLLSAVALSIALASTQDAPAPADLVAVRRLINSGEPHKALECLEGDPPDQGSSAQARIELLRGVSHYQAGDPARAAGALAGEASPERLDRWRA